MILSIFIASSLFGMTSQERGLEIAIEADKRDSGFIDQTVKMIMTLRNKHGQESSREVKLKTFEMKNDGDKSLSIKGLS